MAQESRRGRVIAIANRKGGVGKSSAAANIGAAHARRGRRVLVIDGDSQRNLSLAIGQRELLDDPETMTIDHVFRNPKAYALEAIRPSVEPGVDLLYGSTKLEDTANEILTMQHPSSGLIMQRIVRLVQRANTYDDILIDTPGSEGLILKNALVAADFVLVPVQTDFAGVDGLGNVKRVLLNLNAQDAFEEQPPPILVFPSMVSESSTTQNELLAYIRSDDFIADNRDSVLSIRALQTAIHRNQSIADAYGANVSIFAYEKVDRKTGRRRRNDEYVLKGRDEYAALAEEIDHVG